MGEYEKEGRGGERMHLARKISERRKQQRCLEGRKGGRELEQQSRNKKKENHYSQPILLHLFTINVPSCLIIVGHFYSSKKVNFS